MSRAPLIDPDTVRAPRHPAGECASPPLHGVGTPARAPADETRTRRPTGAARRQISGGTEGSGSQEAGRRPRRRTGPSSGRRRAPAIRTHQEPARRQRQHGQARGRADRLPLREAIDRPGVAITTRSGAGDQRQSATRRGADDDLQRTPTVLMGRANPRGPRSLDQDGARQDDGENACHTEAATEATHADRTLAGTARRPEPIVAYGSRASCQRALATGTLGPTGGARRILTVLVAGSRRSVGTSGRK